ncbi:hypothetical protein B0H19DRAFT_234824 [Mycena capillaripes]|nr:hypothetical protein B0H19DRAFT_234824 [Mycena capillaripes]
MGTVRGGEVGSGVGGANARTWARTWTWARWWRNGHGHGPPFSDYSSDGEGECDDSDKPPEERKRWFAGGEHSGISVENPDHPHRLTAQSIPGGGIVRDLLRRAAEDTPKTGARPAPHTPAAGTPFIGGGHTLGSDEVESTFTVEDSLMRYGDPEHAGVLETIHSGCVRFPFPLPHSFFPPFPSFLFSLLILMRDLAHTDRLPPRSST